VADSLSSELRSHGWTLHFGGNFDDRNIVQKFMVCEQLPLNEGLSGIVRSLFRIGRFDQRTRIIHSHSTSALIFGLALKLLRCRRAIIIHTFHLCQFDSPVRRVSKSLLYRFPNRLHCSSRELSIYVENYYKIPQRKVVLLPLGADDKRFSPATPAERRLYRKYFGFAPRQFTLLFVGRLNPEKNVKLLLAVLARDKSLAEEVHLLIAGDGPLEADLRKEVRNLRLEKTITFLGHVKDLRSIYGAADLLILPSRSEAFGLVVVEAALCALPCLRSDTFGARDQIEDGVDGEIFHEGDQSDLYRRLRGLLADPERVRQMGLAARRKAEAQFTLNAFGEQFHRVLKCLVRGGSCGGAREGSAE
jgi:glycosyltransferase involved in cell wall biosynthesis